MVITFCVVGMIALLAKTSWDLREHKEEVERQRRESLMIEAQTNRTSEFHHMLYIAAKMDEMTQHVKNLNTDTTHVTVTNCPNCGAPYTGKNVCEYCGTVFPREVDI